MLSIRKGKGFTQSVMAAKLDISDRAYNYYEQEKRELPSSVAVRFCSIFDIKVDWLLTGETKSTPPSQLGVLADSVAAVLDEAEKRGVALSNEKLGLFSANVYDRCSNGTGSPKDVASNLFGLLE